MHRLCHLTILFFALCFNGGSVVAGSVTAKSWLVSDINGRIIRGENIDAIRPIASISKLITAMVVLDAKQDMNEQIVFRTFTSGKKHQKKVTTSNALTRAQLLDMALVHSDNHAALLLCNNYPGGSSSCVDAMSRKVAQLGMMSTSMFDPTGLDPRNVSTAKDLILLARAAKNYPVIVNASSQAKIEIKMQKKWFFFNNTNPMIGKDHRIVVSKTGFINASGGCIIMLLNTEMGDRVVVVLGSKNTHTRIPEAEFISNLESDNTKY